MATAQGYPQTAPYVWWKWHDAYDREASRDHMEQIDRALNYEGLFYAGDVSAFPVLMEAAGS